MKRSALIGTGVLVALMAAGIGRAATGGSGHQMNFVGKFMWAYSDSDSDTLWPGRDEFTTTLVGIKLSGLVSEHLAYCAEFTSSYNPERNTGGLTGPSGPAEVGTVGVRRVSLAFHDILPWTKLELGTFLPPLGNYMPRELNDLDLIQYPLMYSARFVSNGLYGNRPAVRDLAPWQQAGFNLTLQTPYMLKMQVGFWDGALPNGWANANPTPGKAASFILTFDPRPPLSLSVGVWNEEFQQAFPGHAQGAKRHLTMWYLYGSYRTEVLEITADFASGMIPDGQLDNTGQDFKPLSFEGYQVTVGYWINPRLEAVVRYERFDPNTVDSVQVTASRYDASVWMTLGVNYRLTDQAELSVNYVRKQELAEDIHPGEPGQDPDLPGYSPKYSSQRNNLILLQLQIWQ